MSAKAAEALAPRSEHAIDSAAIEAYLRRTVNRDAALTSVRPLGETRGAKKKSYGYGRPLLLTFTTQGKRRTLVLRTSRPDRFGHDRRADRMAAVTLAYDTFAEIPRHVHAIDAGVFDDDGALISVPRGEPFLVTDYVPGRLYADDLEEVAELRHARPRDLARAEILARHLASIHHTKAPPETYVRAVRDLVGHGEGIFGLLDNYPAATEPTAVITPSVLGAERLRAIELEAVRWRWRLRAYTGRARRTHGDYHPFNLLFHGDHDLAVLDCSRGAAGDPADDVTCLSINYLFFALCAGDRRFSGSMRELWDTFWRDYLEETRDREVLDVVAPFFTWRALVLASPVWYPNVPDRDRDVLLVFAERLLAGEAFDPERVEVLLG